MNNISITRSLVERYAHDCEAWKVQHDHAMECFDCEEHLSRGLQLFHWIENLDAQLREADALGVLDYTSEVYEAVTDLYRVWLIPCDDAFAWISKIDGVGYAPDNLAEFREACQTVSATIEDREWLACSARSLRNSLSD